jgi:hypothetical protein
MNRPRGPKVIFQRITPFIVFRKSSPMAMVPQEGNSNTPCFLLPPFQGEIKPPAMRVVVDFTSGIWNCPYRDSMFNQYPAHLLDGKRVPLAGMAGMDDELRFHAFDMGA